MSHVHDIQGITEPGNYQNILDVVGRENSSRNFNNKDGLTQQTLLLDLTQQILQLDQWY